MRNVVNGQGDAADAFEACLREEFETMRRNFEHQLEEQGSTILTLKRQLCIEQAERKSQVDELTSLKHRMSERFITLKQRCDELEL